MSAATAAVTNGDARDLTSLIQFRYHHRFHRNDAIFSPPVLRYMKYISDYYCSNRQNGKCSVRSKSALYYAYTRMQCSQLSAKMTSERWQRRCKDCWLQQYRCPAAGPAAATSSPGLARWPPKPRGARRRILFRSRPALCLSVNRTGAGRRGNKCQVLPFLTRQDGRTP